MIYIIAHKKTTLPILNNYIPLQVGAALHDNIYEVRDDTGENISIKNPNYCELTGLYWIWKNTNDDYKGLVHYRRFFSKHELSSDFSNIYSYDDLVNFLSNGDIVTSQVENFKQNAHDEILVSCCTEEILYKLRKNISDLYPNYLKEYDAFFSQNKSVLFNMMFCKANIFDDYCSWLFKILFHLEQEINLDSLNNYQKRIYGFLGERLLNIWCMHNGLKEIHIPVMNVETDMKEKITVIRRRNTNEIIYNINKMLKRK